MGTSSTIEHQTRRLLVALPQPYEEAVTLYEKLVPPVDPAAFAQAGSWNEVLEIAALTAPHGFMCYYRSDIGAAMAGSPSKGRATQYLMGNHTIAERMFRHDPAVMLHAPLRTLVFVGPDGGTTFAVDQPSLMFGSFNDPIVTAVGRELDSLLATLIRLLGGQVPQELIGENE
ncbi:DUF302 domain-containing protein [Nocardia sp. NPDC059091]|uniref:DUF302 domain-containing protein n=1 Tax=Nocardia sp. NPDC059091 TaxID=3346724 RepID=UPI0036A7E1CE